MSNKSFDSVKSIGELCTWLADTMDSGGYLNWPLYEGQLGEDSGGGTNLNSYNRLNRMNILTLNSQDGFCDESFTDAHIDFLNYMVEKQVIKSVEDVVGAQEKQISYLDCLMPLTLFNTIAEGLVKNTKTIQTYISYHPKLGDGIAYTFDERGRLKPASLLVPTTSYLQLKNGQIVEQSRLGKPIADANIPTNISDLLKKDKNMPQYRMLLNAFFRFGTNSNLMRELISGHYVICTFYAPTPCTFPNTAADLLFNLVLQLTAPPEAISAALPRRKGQPPPPPRR